MFDFECEENAFEWDTTKTVGGSTKSRGVFVDRKTDEHWLGKTDVGTSIEDSLVLACREKLANELYRFFEVRVPRLRISLQTLAMNEENLNYHYEELAILNKPRFEKAWHIMSRWFDRFENYGYLPKFQGDEIFKLMVGQSEIPEKGLGHILAVAHWINDTDVLNTSGKNVGYQLQLDQNGQLYALSCKIDPGGAFADFKKRLKLTTSIQLALPNEVCVKWEQLPERTQQEYLYTVKKIIETDETTIKSFFAGKIAEILESHAAQTREDYVSVKTLIEKLLSRQKSLKQIFQTTLKNLQEESTISVNTQFPPLLQRLYCQARLLYETEVKEKVGFYIPLDVRDSPNSEQRKPIDYCINHFLDSTKEVLLLLGPSGSGKSLYTQQLVNALWKVHFKDKRRLIPLRIELKQFSERTVGQCVINTLFDEYHYSLEEIKELQQYRFLFILDGYDEIGNQAKVNLLQKHHALDGHYGLWKNAQFIITCRDRYFYDLDRTLFYGEKQEQGLQVQYLSDLTNEAQVKYLMDYRQANPQKNLPNYEILIKENPQLHELLANPLVLRIFRDALPQWQKANPQKSVNELTQYALYTAFMDQWFNSEAVRLCMQSAKVLENLPEKFSAFSLSLAVKMFVSKVNKVSQPLETVLWEQFFQDQSEKSIEARMGCPLKRQSNIYEFVHTSFLEYFVARYCWEQLRESLVNLIDELAEVWPQRLFHESHVVLNFLREAYLAEEEDIQEMLRQKLWLMVQRSKSQKDNEKVVVAAANAVTLMKAIGAAFRKYEDFSNVCIRRADLSEGFLHRANFQHADLRDVNFSRAFLCDADFREADLQDVQFGEKPSISCGKSVQSICYSPNGLHMTIAAEEVILLWDIETNKRLSVLQGHSAKIISLNFSPDGQLLASGSMDGTIRLWWSMQDYEEIVCLKGHKKGHDHLARPQTGGVTSISFTPDGQWLASGSHDKSIRLWSMAEFKEVACMLGHTDSVVSLSFSPDGQLLASGSRHSIRLWSMKDRKEVACLKGRKNLSQGGGTPFISFSPDGQWLASGSFDGVICLWSVEERKEVACLLGHTDWILGFSFSPDGQCLASASKDATVRLWSMKERKEIGCLRGHKQRVDAVRFSPDGQWLASGDWDGHVRLWSMRDRQNMPRLSGPRSPITSVSFSRNGQWLVFGSYDGTIHLCSMRDRKEIAWTGHKSWHGVRWGDISLSFSSDGELLASGSNHDETIRLWSVKERKEIARLSGHRRGVLNLSFSPDGQWLASTGTVGDKNDTVLLWSVKERKKIASLPGHKHPVRSLCFSPDSQWLATWGNKDNKNKTTTCQAIYLWSVKQRKQVASLGEYHFYDDNVYSIRFSPDGQWLALGGWENTLMRRRADIWLWSMKDFKETARLLGGELVTSLSFSPNGQWLASAGGEFIQLWSLQNFQCVAVLHGHTGKVTSIAFDSQSRLASGSEDASVLLWEPLLPDNPTEWRVVWRGAGAPTLFVLDAHIQDAKLSLTNKELLLQRGAKDKAPHVPHSPRFFQQTSPETDNNNLDDSLEEDSTMDNQTIEFNF